MTEYSLTEHTEHDYALAVDLAEEAMSYVSDYFREKWDMDERLAELKAKIPPEVYKEFWTT